MRPSPCAASRIRLRHNPEKPGLPETSPTYRFQTSKGEGGIVLPFPDRHEYDGAEAALLPIVRAVFLAGWRAADGTGFSGSGAARNGASGINKKILIDT